MKLRNLLLALGAVALLSSCEMIMEDEDTVNCGLFVNFKYDYNLQRADMFGDHVGGVTLYVFDSDGHFVRSYEENNIPMMARMYGSEYMHTMQIQDLPDGEYRFVALANQKPYNQTLATTGAKYRRAEMNSGDDNEKLTVTLDRITKNDGSKSRVSNEAPLDTLWHGMTGAETVKLKNSEQVFTTISMMRDTKMLTIGLHNLDDPTDISTDEFDYFIVDNNGRIGYNNTLLEDEELVYTPFHKWDTHSTDEKGNILNTTAHACLTFNRLIWHEVPEENTLLVIRKKKTDTEEEKDVAVINLTDFLAQGRNAFDTYAYSRQEYLDRAYDFYMDFFIKNEKWQYVELRIGMRLNILSWAKRIENISLE